MGREYPRCRVERGWCNFLWDGQEVPSNKVIFESLKEVMVSYILVALDFRIRQRKKQTSWTTYMKEKRIMETRLDVYLQVFSP